MSFFLTMKSIPQDYWHFHSSTCFRLLRSTLIKYKTEYSMFRKENLYIKRKNNNNNMNIRDCLYIGVYGMQEINQIVDKSNKLFEMNSISERYFISLH